MTVLFCLVAAVEIALCTATFLAKTKRSRTIVLWLARAAVLAGALCAAVAVVLASRMTADAETLAWARDAWTLWLRAGGVFTLVVGGITGAAALIRHKLVSVRRIAAAAGSLLLLLLGRAYASICRAEAVDVLTPVVLWTVGCALLLSLPFALEDPDRPPPCRSRRQR